jgi:hypothetical protein
MALGVPVTVRGDRAPRPAAGRILQILVDHEEVALPARAHQEPFELVEPVLLGECGPPEVSSQAPSARGQIVKALQSRQDGEIPGPTDEKTAVPIRNLIGALCRAGSTLGFDRLDPSLAVVLNRRRTTRSRS